MSKSSTAHILAAAAVESNKAAGNVYNKGLTVVNVANNKGQSKAATVVQMAEAIKATASADVTTKLARPELARMAKAVFSKPVSTADAAKKLGFSISTAGMDKEDTHNRAWVQRLRVNLQRALKDAERLLVDSSKGRKAADDSEADEAGDEAPAVKGKLLDVVLRALPQLSNAELDTVTDALLALTSRA